MNFPRFWAKGRHESTQARRRPVAFECWRWSDTSLADAQTLAQAAARKVTEAFAQTGRLPHRYAYADRPLREPVLRELRNGAGELAGVITRNSYGCLVLNTARVMFIDVDQAATNSPGGGLLRRLFGKSSTAPAASTNFPEAEAWLARHPGWGWRIYRTRAGLRLLASHALFDPAQAETDAAFQAVNADPLYRQLCRVQKSFRARLTPKPWRIGVGAPTGRWPWPDADAEARFREWEQQYLSACGDWATCQLAATLGNGAMAPEVQLIVGVHDEATRAQSALKLA
jgi:hypothetical protein